MLLIVLLVRHLVGLGSSVAAFLQVLLMFGPEYARACGAGALEPLGIALPDKNYPGMPQGLLRVLALQEYVTEPVSGAFSEGSMHFCWEHALSAHHRSVSSTLYKQ